MIKSNKAQKNITTTTITTTHFHTEASIPSQNNQATNTHTRGFTAFHQAKTKPFGAVPGAGRNVNRPIHTT